MREDNYKPVSEINNPFLCTWAWGLAYATCALFGKTWGEGMLPGSWSGDEDVVVIEEEDKEGGFYIWHLKYLIPDIKSDLTVMQIGDKLKNFFQLSIFPGMHMFDFSYEINNSGDACSVYGSYDMTICIGLGSAEGEDSRLFKEIDGRWNIYQPTLELAIEANK